MKTAYITEICTYKITVPNRATEQQAEDRFLNLGSVDRDQHFVECKDRNVHFHQQPRLITAAWT